MIGFGVMGIFWILVIVAVVAGVVVLARSGGLGSGGSGPASGTETPEEILRRRYAKGEIDRDEYQQRLTDLRR